MIPANAINAWREFFPWTNSNQVEQDLVISRAIIDIFSEPLLRESLAFRGGTALNKLFFESEHRYSEDIDLVQIPKKPIGPVIDVLRQKLDSWLGEPKRNFKDGRVTLIYRFQTELEPVTWAKLKIEINNCEHFCVLGHQELDFSMQNPWHSGNCKVTTYRIEELLATKLRALYQRKKGRDLFDLDQALTAFAALNVAELVRCFLVYMENDGNKVTRAQFEKNLAEKIKEKMFINDIRPLLRIDSDKYDMVAGSNRVLAQLISLLPGDPWQGDKISGRPT